MAKPKSVADWTRKDFESLPYREDWTTEVICTSLIIMPAKFPWYWRIKNWWVMKVKERGYPPYPLHDSGYLCMDFVAVFNGEPICRMAGCSDVVHLEGIGGYGRNWVDKYGGVPDMVPPSDWSIDCLPVSGFLQLFNRKKILCGAGLSSFEIYTVGEHKKLEKK